MAKFMMILHSPPGQHQNVSPTEIQHIIEKYEAWFNKLRESGRLLESHKLREEGGKVFTMKGGRVSVVDGPYTEAKEVVAGYGVIRADSYEEAVELMRDCPHLAFGRLELRETDTMGRKDD